MSRESRIADRVARMCLGGHSFPMRKTMTITVSVWQNISIQHLISSVETTIRNDLARAELGGFEFTVSAKVKTPGVLMEAGPGGKNGRKYAVDVTIEARVSPKFDEVMEWLAGGISF